MTLRRLRFCGIQQGMGKELIVTSAFKLQKTIFKGLLAYIWKTV